MIKTFSKKEPLTKEYKMVKMIRFNIFVPDEIPEHLKDKLRAHLNADIDKSMDSFIEKNKDAIIASITESEPELARLVKSLSAFKDFLKEQLEEAERNEKKKNKKHTKKKSK